MPININVSVTVNPASQPLTVEDINGNPLSDGSEVTLINETVEVNDPGQTVVSISGGVPPYSVSISSGAVPDGMELNLDETGTIVQLSGTPASDAAGTDEFGIDISDSSGQTVQVNTKKKK